MGTKISKLIAGTALCSVLNINALRAAEIDTNIAQMQAMDKITGRVSVIDVPVNGEVKFGSFSVVVRACKTRPPEETPENFAFVDVVDTYKNDNPVNIFRGWMISSSPALNAVEHPIYDIWLLKCINGTVNQSELLDAEALKAREQIVRAAKKADENLKKSKDKEDIPEVEGVSDEMGEDISEVKKEIPDEVAPIKSTERKDTSPSSPVVDQEDGAPKSLLNIKMDEEQKIPAPEMPEEFPQKSEEPEIAAVNEVEDTAVISMPDAENSIVEEPEIENKVKEASETLLPVTNVPPEADFGEDVIPDGGQLIDFSAEEIPEEEFEINAEALAN